MTNVDRRDDFEQRDRDIVTDNMRRELERSGLSPATDPGELRSETPDAIHADIARTRAEMSGTVDAIQERLKPDRLADQAKDAISSVGDHAVRTAKEAMHNVSTHAKETVREATIGRAEHAVSSAGDTAKGFSATMSETIRQNPIPALIAGASIGWLLMKSREADRHSFSGSRRTYPYRPYETYQPGDPYQGYQGFPPSSAYASSGLEGKGTIGSVADRTRETVADTASSVKESVGGMVSSTQETVGDVTARAQETMSDVTHRAQETMSDMTHRAGDMTHRAQEQMQVRTRQVQSEFEHILQENPLALGAVAALCGAAFALLLPTTRAENQWMGETRDSLIASAKEAAQETAQKAQRVIEEAQHNIENESKDKDKDKDLHLDQGFAAA